MKCLICDSNTHFYFKKKFNIQFLDEVEYVECDYCNTVFSKNHYYMSNEDWNKLNSSFHGLFLGTDNFEEDKNWIFRINSQIKLINNIYKLGLINSNDWLDYGCGDGKLANKLSEISKINIDKYDISYENKNGYINKDKLDSKRYSLVINTSVLEHLRTKEELLKIGNLVSDNGVLALHTFISEKVPQDDKWFYLLYAHCIFHSNAGMKILFDKWGFISSIYNVDARMWIMFKKDVKEQIEIYNKNITNQSEYLYYKIGFNDYWK